jgi:hypothetical protein
MAAAVHTPYRTRRFIVGGLLHFVATICGLITFAAIANRIGVIDFNDKGMLIFFFGIPMLLAESIIYGCFFTWNTTAATTQWTPNNPAVAISGFIGGAAIFYIWIAVLGAAHYISRAWALHIGLFGTPAVCALVMIILTRMIASRTA